MKLVSALQEKFGFTGNEIKAVLFLSVTLVLGLTIRWFRETPGTQHELEGVRFDYSRTDSEFVARSSNSTPGQDLAIGRTEEKPTAARKVAPQPGSINLNTASMEELSHLPGIGAEYAKRILQYRKQYGPFSTVDDITSVRGIGQKKLERLRPFVTVK